MADRNAGTAAVHFWCAFVDGFAWLLVLAALIVSSAALAVDYAPPSLTAWQRASEGHLTIEWMETTRVQQKRNGDRLVLRFARPLATTSTAFLNNLSNFIDPDRTTINGSDLSLALKPGVTLKVNIRDKRLITVAFFHDPAIRPSSVIRASAIDDGVRLILDWPGPTKVETNQDINTLRLEIYPAWEVDPIELNSLQRTLEPWFRGLRSERTAESTSIVLVLEPQITSSIRPDGASRTIVELVRDASTLPTPAAGPSSNHVFIPRMKPLATTSANVVRDKTGPPIPRRRPAPPSATERIASTSEKTGDGQRNLTTADGSPDLPEAFVIGWDKPVGAAIFTRAGHLWAIFDEPDSSLLSVLPAPSSFVGPASIVPADGGTALRLPLRSNVPIGVTRTTEGHWRMAPIAPMPAPSQATRDLQRVTASGQLQIGPLSGQRIVSVVDPAVGDRIDVLPALTVDSGYPVKRRFVDLEFLPTVQGLAWRPMNDDLTINLDDDVLEISSPGRLSLPTKIVDTSTASDPSIIEAKAEKMPIAETSTTTAVKRPALMPVESNTTPHAAADTHSSHVNLADQGVEPTLINEYRRIRRQAIARSAPETRDRARLDLARLLLSERLAIEARTVLHTVPEDADDDIALEKQALLGVAAFLIGRMAEASTLLLDQGLDDDREIGIWRAALSSVEDDWRPAAEGWRTAGDVLDSYPPRLRLDLGLLALEAAIETEDDEMISKGVRRLNALPRNPYDEARIDAMKALKAERTGDLDRARNLLTNLTENPNPTIRTLADFKLAAMDIEANANDPDILAAFDRRMPKWRGHPDEPAMLDELARRFRDANALRKALSTWRRLIELYPEAADSESLKEARQTTYAQALANATDPAIDLLEVYTIYLDFIDLLPGDPEVRDFQRHLARHLTDLDLLDEAIDVLQPLMTSSTDDIERADLAVETATLMLLQDRVAPALAVLDEFGDADAIQPPFDEKRRLVRAQLLAKLGRTEDALRELRDLQSQDARRVQARIFWDERDWPRIAASVESYFASLDPESLLTEDDQELVLWLSLARQRLGSTKQLEDLRGRFGSKMKGSAYAEAFEVATQAATQTTDINALLAATENQLAELQRFRSKASVASRGGS